MAAVLGYAGPLLAQEGGVGIRFGDLSSEPTHTTVDRFEVQLTHLDATATYEVVVASDNATALGIGACGRASQSQTVTGVEAQNLAFVVYACTLGRGTLTAEVRPSGAAAAEVTVSQALTVLAIPEGAPAGVRGAPAAAAATRGATRAGTPGIVPNVRFDTIKHNSARANWGKPSDGDNPLTGFGLLLWTGPQHPDYGDAFVVGAASRSHTYTGLQPNTTYKFRIHACNGHDSCGHWTHPPVEFTTRDAPTPEPTPTPTPTPTANPTAPPTVGPPGQVQSLSTSNRTATSFTVHWSPHTDTGGRALTGFGLLRREQPNAWPPHDRATVVGAASRSHSFTGLKYGRGQGVQIRACNGPNSCGAWSAEVTVTPLPGPLPTLALPKTTIAIGERIKIGANDVPVGATAYIRLEGPIQPEGRCPASGAQGQASARAPTPSPGLGYYDSMWIDGCAPGGDDAVVRLESHDGSVLYDRRELTVVSAAPGQVGRPVVSPRDAALQVEWNAPNDGGSAITHYDVQHRAGTSGAWTATEVRTGTSTTITGLLNGTAYQVQVRAANDEGDGDWSDTAIGTPVATAPAPTDPPASITPVNADCPETSSTATAAGPPQNLDVVPLPQRQILLCWSPVSSATRYQVLATENPTANPASRVWVSARTRAADNSPPDDDPDTNVIVDLTDMLLLTSNRGLTTQEAIGLQVRAEIQRGSEPAYFEDSDMVIVVDSPIVAASVFRSNREAAHVSWRTAQSVLLDDNYAYGTYDLRYRLVSGNRQDRNWTPSNLGPRKVELGVSSPHTMRELTGESIYSIQWVYRKDTRASTHDADVYAARPVYIQTVEGPPVGYESSGPVVFAGFPMQYPMKTTTFEYRVCTETFPAGQENDWTEFIKHAFGQWELATNFTVISMRYNNGPCTDYATSDVTEKILNKIKYHTDPDVDIEAEVKAFIRRATTMTKLRPLHRADSRLNEVVMLDDVEALGLGPAFKSRVVWVYSQLGSDIGYLGSEAPDSTNRKCWTEFPGCAVPTLMVDSDGVATGDGYSTDIFLLRSKAIGGLQRPGGDTSVDRSDVRLNQCPTGTSDTYGVLVHEAGHALGLRSADDSPTHPGETSPAMAVDSVMSVGDYVKKCSPYPLDVLAIRALYETR